MDKINRTKNGIKIHEPLLMSSVFLIRFFQEVPEVPKQQSDVDEEKPKNDVEPQTKIDLATRKDGEQENKVPSAAPAEKDNEQPDIREENSKTESTAEVQKPGDLQSADFAK